MLEGDRENKMSFAAYQLPIPIIIPPSGIYRPPLVITILRGADECSDKDALYYSLEHSFSAENLASSTVRPCTTGAGRYEGPLRIDYAGRVKLEAFQHREGTGKGRAVVALYMIDCNAPEVPMPFTETLKKSFSHPLSNVAVPSSVTDDEQRRKKDSSAVSSVGLQFSERKISVPSAVVFHTAPDRITAYYPFDVTVQPVDTGKLPSYTVRISLELNSPQGSGTLQGVTTVRVDQEEATTLGTIHTGRTVQWHSVRNLQVMADGAALGLMKKIMPSVEQLNELDCCAISKEIHHASFSAVRFSLNSLCRVIIGFTNGATFDWRDVGHGIHINHYNGACAFRVYEKGQYVEQAGTHECRERDWFAIEYRFDNVAYIHNGDIFYVTGNPLRPDNTTTYKVAVFIANEGKFPCLTDIMLLPRHDPRVITFRNLTWVPPESIEAGVRQNAGLHDVPVLQGLLRAWIVGHPNCTTAIHKVLLQIPKWATTASIIALTFVAGALGLREKIGQRHSDIRQTPAVSDQTAVPQDGSPQTPYRDATVASNESRRAKGTLGRSRDMQESLRKAAEWSALRTQPVFTKRTSAMTRDRCPMSPVSPVSVTGFASPVNPFRTVVETLDDDEGTDLSPRYSLRDVIIAHGGGTGTPRNVTLWNML